ncbi:MAG TPA: CHRD domain-containing protein [Terriglobales bacterium]|jgi:hypothetical protein|nr:CHRD domain-containing protein [Terriglobales bacterium]
MKKLVLVVLCVFCFGMLCSAADNDDSVFFRTSLNGLNETSVGGAPINTPATGTFKMTVHPDGTVTFTLTFKNLTSMPLFSHIHFGFPAESGGVMVFLCGGDSQPACPAATSGTITGTITAANVVGPTKQNVTVGDLVTALRLVGEGATYVNLHTTNFPGGEIRGQVHFAGRHD